MNTLHRLFAFLVLPCLFVLAELPSATAQDGGGDGGDVIISEPIAGVDVDARGVLKIRQFDPRLARQRMLAARRQAERRGEHGSELRKVSLNRLEEALAERLDAGETPTDMMRGLAGLTSLEYVFFYPETGDIVIAGPAEPFAADPTGRPVGIHSGSPVLLLEDLVTALRAYAPGAAPTSIISVSIDPTEEGLQRMQRFLASVGRQIRPGDTRRLAHGLKQNLGLQTVTIKGISNATHFARVLVEADYRMKLVGIGLERLPVPLKSYVERVHPAAVAANALQRWYFQPNYDGISVTEDGLAMKINERGLQLVGENERVVGGGRRVRQAARGNRASEAFCREFTEKFSLIAQRVRVYAELEDLVDLAIAAAYIQERDFYGQAGWRMPVFGDESRFSVQTYTAPEQVETAVNAIWRGNTLMTPLGGGVHMQPRLALQSDRLEISTDGSAAKAKQQAGPTGLEPGQWWWD